MIARSSKIIGRRLERSRRRLSLRRRRRRLSLFRTSTSPLIRTEKRHSRRASNCGEFVNGAPRVWRGALGPPSSCSVSAPHRAAGRERIPETCGHSHVRPPAHGWIPNNAADFAPNLPLYRNLVMPAVAASDL